MRHLAVADLWVQDRLRARDFELIKVPGKENVADLLTKYLGKPEHEKHVEALGLRAEEGRAASASKIGEQVVASCLSHFYDPSLSQNDHDYIDCMQVGISGVILVRVLIVVLFK